MLDASAGGVLLNMTYNDACELIDRVATNSSSWPTERIGTQKKAGVHELSEISSLSAQVASLANLIKTSLKPNANAPSASAPSSENTAAAIEQSPTETPSCVFCQGHHIFADCSSNSESVNFVDYNNRYNSNRNNNSYSKSYNSGWRNHPNHRWGPSNNNAQTPGANTEASTSQRPGKEQVKAIPLRSGKDLAEIEGTSKREKIQNEKYSEDVSTPEASKPNDVPTPRLVTEYPPLPFPQRLKKAHEEKQFRKFLDVLKQLHVNVTLIEA